MWIGDGHATKGTERARCGAATFQRLGLASSSRRAAQGLRLATPPGMWCTASPLACNTWRLSRHGITFPDRDVHIQRIRRTHPQPTVFPLVSRPLYEPRSLASVGVEQDVHVAGAVDAVHEVQLDVGRAVRWYCLRRTRRSAALPASSGPRLAGFPTIPGRICYERSRPAAPRGATPRWNESSSSRASEAAGDKDRERMVVPLITMRSPGRCGDHDPRRFRSSSALTVLIAGFHSLLGQCASTSRNHRGSFLSSAVTRRSRV